MSFLETSDGTRLTPALFREKLHRERFSAYVGSGVVASDYGDWKKLIKDLCGHCCLTFDTKDLESADGLMNLADRACRHRESDYRHFLSDKFGERYDGSIPKVYMNLLKLPFRSILTTNYDDDLADANRHTEHKKQGPYVYPDLPTTEVGGNGGIFYLHGKPQTPDFPIDSLVLGALSFKRAYTKHSPLHDFLKTVWLQENIILIGCTLREPPLKTLLRTAKRIAAHRRDEFGVQPKAKVMIRPRSQLQDAETRRNAESLGLTLWCYDDGPTDAATSTHKVLYEFIRDASLLADPIAPVQGPPELTDSYALSQ